MGPHQFHPRPPQFNTSVPHKRTTPFQTPKTSQFNTPLSSTPKTPHFHWGVSGTKGILVLNWGVFGVEMRGFWCGTEGVLVVNWGGAGTEGFGGWKGVVLLCGTDVLNWGGTRLSSIYMQISSHRFIALNIRKQFIREFLIYYLLYLI